MKRFFVHGLNIKQHKVLESFLDGKAHTLQELKYSFWLLARYRCSKVYERGYGEEEIKWQAVSYTSNNIKKLLEDGWVVRIGRGLYRLTEKGKNWLLLDLENPTTLRKRLIEQKKIDRERVKQQKALEAQNQEIDPFDLLLYHLRHG